jgi:hypothetical protein
MSGTNASGPGALGMFVLDLGDALAVGSSVVAFHDRSLVPAAKAGKRFSFRARAWKCGALGRKVLRAARRVPATACLRARRAERRSRCPPARSLPPGPPALEAQPCSSHCSGDARPTGVASVCCVVGGCGPRWQWRVHMFVKGAIKVDGNEG